VTGSTKKAGVLLRVEGQLCFLDASSVVRMAPVPPITGVPGGPPGLLGIALHEGSILPVVSLGASRHPMVVCKHSGELLGLVGAEVVRTGVFDVASGQADAVEYEGRTASSLDLTALYGIVEGSGRLGRFAIGRRT
jgi:chemotaxis signal transduction protein